MAPGVSENHVTAGFSWQLNQGNKLNISFMNALEESVSGQNPLDRGQQVELKMQQFELGISWSKRW